MTSRERGIGADPVRAWLIERCFLLIEKIFFRQE
jgi:hypothetical protein